MADVQIEDTPEFQALEERTTAIEGMAYSSTQYDDWATLSGTGGSSGDNALILDDPGTHTDPVTTNTVPNSGIYRYTTDWEWIADSWLNIANDTNDAADRADAAALSAEQKARVVESAVLRWARLIDKRPSVGQFDWVADFEQNIYFNAIDPLAPEIIPYTEAFEPRLAEPTGDGIYLPEASVNLAYTGLNDRDDSAFIDNPDLTITVVEVADLPAPVAAYFAGISTRWPVERVFHIVNGSATGESLQPSVPAGLSGDHTASVFCYGISGQTDIRIGVSQSADVSIDAGERISVSDSGGAFTLRMNAGAECYVAGFQFEAGLAATAYQEGYQILNRLEPRDASFIKPNGQFLIVARWPVVGTSGGDAVVSLANADRSQNLKLTLNWTGAAATLSARDGAAGTDINNASGGGQSFAPGKEVAFLCEYTSTGELMLSVDGGTPRLASDNVLDLTGLSRLRIGGQIPNLNVGTGADLNISPINGDVLLFAYKGWDD